VGVELLNLRVRGRGKPEVVKLRRPYADQSL
jgi:hypothetical protein